VTEHLPCLSESVFVEVVMCVSRLSSAGACNISVSTTPLTPRPKSSFTPRSVPASFRQSAKYRKQWIRQVLGRTKEITRLGIAVYTRLPGDVDDVIQALTRGRGECSAARTEFFDPKVRQGYFSFGDFVTNAVTPR